MKMVSILMCSFNGHSIIEGSISALSKLDITGVNGVEFIFVDNGSKENMESLVQKIWIKKGAPFPLKTFTEIKKGKVSALLKGLEAVEGKYVIICDDDNELYSNYLQNGFEYMEKNSHVGVLGGKGIPTSDMVLPVWFDQFAYNFACGPQASRSGNVYPERNVVYGAGLIFRKSALDKAFNNGFKFIFNYVRSSPKMRNLTNGGEDGELCWAIKFQGYEVHYLDSLQFEHFIIGQKMIDSYLKMIKSRKSQCTLFASLYYRVYNLKSHKVSNYWLKELLYIFINYFNNFKWNKEYVLGEIKRNRSNIKMLIHYRAKYDDYVNQLLLFRDQSKLNQR